MIYDHFGSKEQLFATCVRRTGEALAEHVATAVRKETEPRARLRAGSIAYFRFLQEQLQAWAVLFDEQERRDARFAAEAARIRHRQSELMIDLMAESAGTEPGHEGREMLEAMTLAIAGAYESLSVWWREHPEVPPEQLADWLLDLIWPGLERLIDAARRLTLTPPASSPMPRFTNSNDGIQQRPPPSARRGMRASPRWVSARPLRSEDRAPRPDWGHSFPACEEPVSFAYLCGFRGPPVALRCWRKSAGWGACGAPASSLAP